MKVSYIYIFFYTFWPCISQYIYLFASKRKRENLDRTAIVIKYMLIIFFVKSTVYKSRLDNPFLAF